MNVVPVTNIRYVLFFNFSNVKDQLISSKFKPKGLSGCIDHFELCVEFSASGGGSVLQKPTIAFLILFVFDLGSAIAINRGR